MLISGRYRLARVLGAGGMGRVWLGRDELIGREVAIKELLLPSDITDEQRQVLTQRAMREARAAGRLNHPGIVTVHDVIEHDGAPLIVMEFVSGRSLADAIRADGALPVERVAAIAGAMFAALRVAHDAGIVHRDLKPGNVLLDGDRVVITDFGIASLAGDAQLTRSGVIMGTPTYMAPEQAEHERGSAASDLWSVGATLYTAVEGRPPFEGESVMAVLSAVLTRDPRPPEQADRLTSLLYALLRKDPNQRPTLDQAERLLASAAEGGQGSYAPAGGSEADPQTDQLLSSPGTPGALSAPVPPGRYPGAYAGHPPQPYTGASGATLPPGHSGPSKGSSVPPSRRGSGRRTVLLIGAGAVAMVLLAAVAWLVPGGREGEQGSPPAAGSNPARTADSNGGDTGRPGTPVEITNAIQLTGHAHRVTSVAFSPDGALLASTDDDLIIGGAKTWLWNAGSGKRLAMLVSPPGIGGSSVDTVAFSPDGKWLASGGNRVGEATTYLWRVADRRRVGPMTQSKSIMKSLAFSPDSKTLAGVSNRGTVTIWDTATRRVKVGLPDGNGFRNVAFSPDGRLLANPGRGREVRLSDANTGRTVHMITDATGDDVAFSPDGKTLAVPDSDGTHSLRLYEVATGRSTLAFDRAEGDLVANVIYSPDGKTIASWGLGNVIRLWDVMSRRIRANLIGHSGQVNSVAFSRDGKKIASGSEDKTIRIWNLSG
ncbi:Serine/threonine protein kinase [Actinomadura madurae]|uniref:non-specific serine/threonine protein kinase n=2 Tax=Actinomadura madurae TaxID=1993 RepID=A0A1I5CGC7_9ACTN|nr:Serine/threonine protein kinase [Actinomadura madurae]SPT50711.1 Serine/threonine-protein kinase PrkC [Actinomadura madurae]